MNTKEKKLPVLYDSKRKNFYYKSTTLRCEYLQPLQPIVLSCAAVISPSAGMPLKVTPRGLERSLAW